MTPRDTRRSSVYRAEQLVQRIFDRSADYPTVSVAGSVLTLPPERRFAAIESVQHYLDRVLALRWVRQRWPRAAVPVTVRARRGQQQAHYERLTATIAVPLHHNGRAWALRELVVLHELAHHLVDDIAATAEPGHGPAFLSNLHELTGELIGPEAALLLRVTLADVGASR